MGCTLYAIMWENSSSSLLCIRGYCFEFKRLLPQHLWKWLHLVNQPLGVACTVPYCHDILIFIILYMHSGYTHQTGLRLQLKRINPDRSLWWLELTTCALVLFILMAWCLLRYGVSPFEYALGESGGSLQLAIINAQIKWPAGPNPPYPEALHQFVTWMLQPQPAIRPRIDDIIIHVDKLISKFSNWRIHVYSSEEQMLELVLNAPPFLFQVRDCNSCRASRSNVSESWSVSATFPMSHRFSQLNATVYCLWPFPWLLLMSDANIYTEWIHWLRSIMPIMCSNRKTSRTPCSVYIRILLHSLGNAWWGKMEESHDK